MVSISNEQKIGVVGTGLIGAGWAGLFSAFGRAMETIDRKKMCILTYPVALEHCADQSLELKEITAAVAATAEGYSFPTNLDNDPPKGGLAPETQQAFFMRALGSNMKQDEFERILNEMEAVRLS